MEQQHSPRVVSSHLLTGKCMKIVLFDALIHRDTWRSCVHTVKMRSFIFLRVIKYSNLQTVCSFVHCSECEMQHNKEGLH